MDTEQLDKATSTQTTPSEEMDLGLPEPEVECPEGEQHRSSASPSDEKVVG